jgi:hypothetical protein
VPRKSRPQKPQRWGGSARFCAWPRCDELITTSMLMHGDHWRQVPLHLRDALIKAQRQGDGPGIARATAAIVGYARQQSVAVQGADAR